MKPDPTRARRAFTFIELMIVALIIAILAAIAVPNFLEVRVRAQVAAVKADLTVIAGALEAYRVEHWQYPLNAAPGKPGDWDLIALTTPVPYLTEVRTEVFMRDMTPERLAQLGFTQPPPYRYFNALQVSPDLGLRPADEMTGAYFPGYTAAVVWGMGPSNLDQDKRNAYTQIGENGGLTALMYDPTNGTLSSGDLYTRTPAN